MGVLVSNDSRLLVQGITGRDGSFHTHLMREYGTNIVAGVTPGKGGMVIEDVPVFNTVVDAVEKTGANVSVSFVPARFATSAIFEAVDAGIELIVAITEGIPVKDMISVMRFIKDKGARLIGPNCPGIITPGECKVGILPTTVFKKGRVGVVSRSGTLTYEIVSYITEAGFGESTAVGIGGDPVIGTRFVDMLELFKDDDETEAVVLIGEIGGSDEEVAARYIEETDYPLPVFSFVAGRTAPKDKRMGHAGAIISGGSGTASEKIKALEDAGVLVAKLPSDIGKFLKEELGEK
ncbi:MAG: succinate--CoA ligase subunit alpha [Candidatus Stahlbacteria bacterium]|nr:MAG: succinate--CoA ligase subunit alpha [Candidatus Stahlbacteria bacterium]